MNRQIALALSAVLGIAAATQARAESPGVDPQPFVSTLTRAEVMADLQAFRASGQNPWADDYNPVAQMASSMTRVQAQAAYIAERDSVRAFAGEDSGSVYIARMKNVSQRPTELARGQ